MGDAVRDAARANNLPQLAGEYHSDVTTMPVRCNLAASGYVEVWEPEMSTSEFLQWIRADILPYVTESDTEAQDKSEKAENDPKQNGLDDYDDDEQADEWVEGVCDECGHERTKTAIVHGRRVCIICDGEGDDAA
jgi:hypothetical protein